ncbi:MAG: hypothetical protein LBG48_01215 [Rickettsiales bacterium]|jgi:hypothetical protein|nr:hypothetical protein [Rickettsiales bacterium]
MKIKSESVSVFVKDGFVLSKINGLGNNEYLSINFNALVRMIEDNSEGYDDMDLVVMINNYYGKFNNEQLDRVLNRVRYIINHKDKYKDYRKVKSIELI